ncbi:ABC transporter ATP-binding protein uup [Aureliella helgolandensis]|uniref:ABC transporter ATP-binding protein uup n=1 Tax=Aureliella helgolandensis TaxID=2527968 RepID=A0A518G374_9BACT|nr:ATP-binding cassette domain-containing protein [Aureliella helgolandensis]QDV23025.1 ABC transporter ATP-binding protein uup [Aureliella helgolandensis]
MGTAEELSQADWTLEERMASILGRVGLQAAPSARLCTLSGGQRTRAYLAAAIFASPDFLVLDEPTNNLDRRGRDDVMRLLTTWRAGAIVASHDRELLAQMDAIVELTSLGATRYGGNWTQYRQRKEVELEAAQHDLAHAEKQLAEINRKTQLTAERKQRRDAAGVKQRSRGDMPRVLLGMRKNRAEGSQGENARLAERQKSEASESLASARSRVEILQDLSMSLPSTGLANGRVVLALEGVAAGYEPARPLIRDFSLSLSGPERVSLAGPNGAGKTSLIRLISGELTPFCGTVKVSVEFAMLDQRVSCLDPETSILDNFKRLNPSSSENACRSTLASFLFQSEAALQRVGTLSGGQLLRAGLACILGGSEPPALLMLDEPTNHLDIASIEAIERGLSAYDGALLVISHDETFTKNVGIHRTVELTGNT